LANLSYTDHGLRHSTIVSKRAGKIAQEINLKKIDQELSEIAAFCHDMGNFLGRNYHNHNGALLFFQIFKDDFSPKEMSRIMEAISNHDERIKEVSFADPITAVVILADKSDVHRSRVIAKKFKDIESDIHDRVNYAVKSNELDIDKKKKKIILNLKIDTKFVPIMEYFEIFTRRMVLCRKAAHSLGYDFVLIINNFKLL